MQYVIYYFLSSKFALFIHPRALNTIHFHLYISMCLYDLSIIQQQQQNICQDLIPNPRIMGNIIMIATKTVENLVCGSSSLAALSEQQSGIRDVQSDSQVLSHRTTFLLGEIAKHRNRGKLLQIKCLFINVLYNLQRN